VGTVFIAMNKSENRIYGFAYAKERDQTIYLDLMEVCDGVKGSGIGKLLMSKVVTYAKQKKKQFVELISLTTPSTLRFYDKLGFVRGPHTKRENAKKQRLTMENYRRVDYSSNENESNYGLPKGHLAVKNYNRIQRQAKKRQISSSNTTSSKKQKVKKSKK
jgi:predicted GNAT family acetyltransferase